MNSIARVLILTGMLWNGATDALAQGSDDALFVASPKLTCFGADEDTYKLLKFTDKGIGAIAALTATPISALTGTELIYSQFAQRFALIHRCSETLVDYFADPHQCTPFGLGSKSHRVCTYEIPDTATRSFGHLLCDQTEIGGSTPERSKMSAKCRGEVEVFGLPCQLELTIGKLHTQKGCPK